jgi:hypothetical protein
MTISEPAAALIRMWASEGKPNPWHLAGVLADAIEEGGFAHGGILSRLRTHDMNVINSDWVDSAHGMPHVLVGYDWDQAFGYAGQIGTYGTGSPAPALPGDAVSVEPFGRKDVVRVVALSEGENDGPNWLCVGELRDGRFFALDAGCDYTGWD